MSAWTKSRILEPDETGLGRVIHEGRFYGVPIPVLDYIAEIEMQRDELLTALIGLVECLAAPRESWPEIIAARCAIAKSEGKS